MSWSANFLHEIEVFVNSTQRVELKQLISALKRWLLLEELMLATSVHPPPNVSNYIKELGSLWVPQFGVLQGIYHKVWAFLAEFMLETNYPSGARRRVIRLDINLVFKRVLSQSSSPVYSSVSTWRISDQFWFEETGVCYLPFSKTKTHAHLFILLCQFAEYKL